MSRATFTKVQPVPDIGSGREFYRKAAGENVTALLRDHILRAAALRSRLRRPAIRRRCGREGEVVRETPTTAPRSCTTRIRTTGACELRSAFRLTKRPVQFRFTSAIMYARPSIHSEIHVNHDFLFSYARMDWGPYLKRFYDDLQNAVKRLRGVDTDCAFRDRESIKRGAEWEADLRAALQIYRTIVTIYTPSYFQRDVCLREIRVFQQRQQAFLAADPARTRLRRAIKPVIWIAPFHVPPDLAALQYDTKDDEFFKDRGLSYFLQTSTQKAKYRKFVNDFALDIVETANAVDLPPLINFPSLLDDDPPLQAVVPAGGGFEDGPTHVRFVYIAPTQNLAAAQGRQDYYGPHSRGWKPFLPKFSGPIGALAQRVAGEYNFTSDELTFDAALPGHVRKAEERRNVVVILMDGWAVTMADHRQVVEQLDLMRVPNCGVLVPWATDPQTEQQREQLAKAVRRALWRWAGEGNPARFNDTISSDDEFRDRLAEVLTRLKNDVLMAPDPAGPILAGPPKPTITNMLG